jgi:hypothetical protein
MGGSKLLNGGGSENSGASIRKYEQTLPIEAYDGRFLGALGPPAGRPPVAVAC